MIFDFESQILALFYSSALIQNSKFNSFLLVCWFLGKNLSNFVSPVWKLHNPYCHSVEASLSSGKYPLESTCKRTFFYVCSQAWNVKKGRYVVCSTYIEGKVSNPPFSSRIYDRDWHKSLLLHTVHCSIMVNNRAMQLLSTQYTHYSTYFIAD